jgi:hypothetical protein
MDCFPDMAHLAHPTSWGIMRKLLPQNWNDTLSLIGIVIIPALWVTVELPAEVNGALIVTWTGIWTYYFRKAPSEKH